MVFHRRRLHLRDQSAPGCDCGVGAVQEMPALIEYVLAPGLGDWVMDVRIDAASPTLLALCSRLTTYPAAFCELRVAACRILFGSFGEIRFGYHLVPASYYLAVAVGSLADLQRLDDGSEPGAILLL